VVARKPDGFGPAIHILSMRFFVDRDAKREYAPELIVVGRELLLQMNSERNERTEDHDLSSIIKVCLVGDGGYAIAKGICESLIRSVQAYEMNAFEPNEILKGVFISQPRAALDALFVGERKKIAVGARMVQEASENQINPMDVLSAATLFDWCREDATSRFPAVASAITIFLKPNDQQTPRWTPRALRLIQDAPDAVAVVREIAVRLRPTSWMGSRATILESNARLLEQIDSNGNQALAAALAEYKIRFQGEVNQDRASEEAYDRSRDQRFEQ
jgi:hypothetical protein